MATHTVCDRCGDRIVALGHSLKDGNKNPLDLCGPCYQRFAEFMHPPAATEPVAQRKEKVS
jgi:hypothetical protein